ncbi:lactonase family protein [Embleya scabrispora]|uniref:lactonase family protein n=1 Tax=Embleya scabrispora TaxID=159449 RepID=UPI001374BA55|nr:lactonase family protein [Embleya scabrispora]
MTSPNASDRRGPLVYVGSYTPDMEGHGTGITVCRQDPDSGLLGTPSAAIPAISPSYLTRHPSGRFLYAVSERAGEGAVGAYSVQDERLVPLGEVSTLGAGPCHLAADPTGRFVVVANYGGGSVTVHPIADDGTLGEAATHVRLTGSGPVADRQAASHAHQVTFAAGGGWLVVCDLGSDTVYHLNFDAEAGTIAEGPKVTLPPGTGPRHIAYGPKDLAWLAGELNATVTPLRGDPRTGALTVAGKPFVLSGGEGAPSGIVASADGRFVYAANRGPDTISVLAVDGAELSLVEEIATGGAWPRDLALVGEVLYVANQRGDTITGFRCDPGSGRLTALGVALATGSPTSVLA